MEQQKFKLSHFNDPVLIVEDKLENQLLIEGLCKSMGVSYDVAENGAVALEKDRKNNYSVYIVDLMMPVMDGREFIRELKKFKPEAVILVQTALDSSNAIISVMKMGVFDYIIKPIDAELFIQSLYKALEYNYLKKFEKEQSLNAGKKIRSQIDWLNYKESRRISDKEYSETKSVYSLKTSLAQGAGFGTLITLIDLLGSARQDGGAFYEVDKDVVDLIVENNEYCRLQLEGLNYATEIMEKEYRFEKVDLATYLNRLPEILERVLPLLKDKNLTITYPEIKESHNIMIDQSIMDIVVEELVVNAFKYAAPDSKLNIISHMSEGYVWISVKNDIIEKPYGGVPKEYEKIVLEPFYRIRQPEESVSKADRIGFGLGLAVVDYVVKRHHGIFLIHDVGDHTGEKVKKCVMSEILLPFQD